MILGQSRHFILRNVACPAAVFRQNARTLSSASSVKELVDHHELVKSSKPLLNKTPVSFFYGQVLTSNICPQTGLSFSCFVEIYISIFYSTGSHYYYRNFKKHFYNQENVPPFL